MVVTTTSYLRDRESWFCKFVALAQIMMIEMNEAAKGNPMVNWWTRRRPVVAVALTWNKLRSADVSRARNFICRRTFVMSGPLSAEAGEIGRRLQALEKRLNIAGARASTTARDTVENLGDSIASALSGWADRFREGASAAGDQSAALGRDAARLGTVARNRIADETGRRPLFALAVAVGVGILIGMAVRNSRSDLSR
jgi:hypothetical protein